MATLGKHISDEQKIKISIARRGIPAWNKGTKGVMSPNSRSFQKGCIPWNKGLKGKIKLSEKTKIKISESHMGLSISNETKGKISESLRGEKHWRWKGGIGSLYEVIRKSWVYRAWRTEIFIRDEYTCQMCGKKGGQLQVDHWPIPFWKLIKDNNINSLEDALKCEKIWDKKVNRTLCIDCHKKTETYGWGSANQKQEIEKLMKLMILHKAITIQMGERGLQPLRAIRKESEPLIN